MLFIMTSMTGVAASSAELNANTALVAFFVETAHYILLFESRDSRPRVLQPMVSSLVATLRKRASYCVHL